MFELNKISKERLSKVHPDLQKVVNRAVEIINELGTNDWFVVSEGLRTLERQRELFKQGLSQLENKGRHLQGHAVDIAAWIDKDKDQVVDRDEIYWTKEEYIRLNVIFRQAAKDVEVPIEWGGDWKSFKDRPHYQLPYKLYPGL